MKNIENDNSKVNLVFQKLMVSHNQKLKSVSLEMHVLNSNFFFVCFDYQETLISV